MLPGTYHLRHICSPVRSLSLQEVPFRCHGSKRVHTGNMTGPNLALINLSFPGESEPRHLPASSPRLSGCVAARSPPSSLTQQDASDITNSRCLPRSYGETLLGVHGHSRPPARGDQQLFPAQGDVDKGSTVTQLRTARARIPARFCLSRGPQHNPKLYC